MGSFHFDVQYFQGQHVASEWTHAVTIHAAMEARAFLHHPDSDAVVRMILLENYVTFKRRVSSSHYFPGLWGKLSLQSIQFLLQRWKQSFCGGESDVLGNLYPVNLHLF